MRTENGGIVNYAEKVKYNIYKIYYYIFESLPHGLGQCPFGNLIRIERYQRIRNKIANELRKNKNLEVHEVFLAFCS